MAIINVTTDSFSADGLAQPDADIAADALAQARRAAAGEPILSILVVNRRGQGRADRN